MSFPPPWAPPFGYLYGPYPGPPPQQAPPIPYGSFAPVAAPPPPPYSPYSYGYPPPPGPPQRIHQEDNRLYRTPDVPRIKIHIIQAPPYAVFSPGGPGSFNMVRHKLPLSMTIPDFFRELNAFKGKKVIEEAVEEGNGIWQHGTKLIWGCQDAATLGGVQWKRDYGLAAAADEAVWVVVRDKTYYD